MLQSRLRTFNIFLSIHLYANGALWEPLTLRTGRGTLSSLMLSKYKCSPSNSGVSSSFHSTTDEISRSFKLIFGEFYLPWGSVINLSTCMLIPCSRGLSRGLLFLFFYRKPNSAPAKCMLRQAVPSPSLPFFRGYYLSFPFPVFSS